jgi:membrane-associated phospholipid phosphatase
MLTEMLKMPPPLVMIGIFYVVIAVNYLIKFVINGYGRDVLTNIITKISKNLPKVGILFIILLLLIFFVDLPITTFILKHTNDQVYKILDFINAMGQGWFIGGVVFSIILLSKLWRNERLHQAAIISFMALIYAGIINLFLKIIINRQRPSVLTNPYNFFHYILEKNSTLNDLFYASNSMPSGHTISIVVAIVPFWLIAQKKITKCILFVCAGIIMVARVYTINHWASDVYVASLLGILIGKSVFDSNIKRIK